MNEIEQLKMYVVQSKELSEPLNYFLDLTDQNVFAKIKSHRAIENINQHTELMAVVQLVQKETNERLGKPIKQFIPIFHEIPGITFFMESVCLWI